MSHNFLFSLYEYIDRRLAHVERIMTREKAGEAARQFAAGQIEVLCEAERFLNENFDAKLPKRLRNQRTEAPKVCRRVDFGG